MSFEVHTLASYASRMCLRTSMSVAEKFRCSWKESPASTASIYRTMGKQLTSSLSRSLSGLLHANYRQRISQSKFIIETNLDVVNPVVLELHATEHVDIRNIGI